MESVFEGFLLQKSFCILDHKISELRARFSCKPRLTVCHFSGHDWRCFGRAAEMALKHLKEIGNSVSLKLPLCSFSEFNSSFGLEDVYAFEQNGHTPKIWLTEARRQLRR
jgi:hypothetical protein